LLAIFHTLFQAIEDPHPNPLPSTGEGTRTHNSRIRFLHSSRDGGDEDGGVDAPVAVFGSAGGQGDFGSVILDEEKLAVIRDPFGFDRHRRAKGRRVGVGGGELDQGEGRGDVFVLAHFAAWRARLAMDEDGKAWCGDADLVENFLIGCHQCEHEGAGGAVGIMLRLGGGGPPAEIGAPTISGFHQRDRREHAAEVGAAEHGGIGFIKDVGLKIVEFIVEAGEEIGVGLVLGENVEIGIREGDALKGFEIAGRDGAEESLEEGLDFGWGFHEGKSSGVGKVR